MSEIKPLLGRKYVRQNQSLISVQTVFLVFFIAASVALAIALGVTYSTRQNKPEVRFAVIGDTNYGTGANLTINVPKLELDALIAELNNQELDFVVHVGDIGGGVAFDCSEFGLTYNLNTLSKLRHPIVFTPGDNEWFDCYNLIPDFPYNDFFHPPYALSRVRQHIYQSNVNTATGRLHAFGPNGRSLDLISQKDDPEFSQFIENTMWHKGSSTFCTVHIHGSECNTCTFGGNTTIAPIMLAERNTRFAAGLKWITSCFLEAKRHGSSNVMLFSQAPLAPNFMTPKTFKLDDTTAITAAKNTQSLRVPVSLRTMIIERIRNETLAFGPTYRVAPHEYASWLAYYLSYGYSEQDIDETILGLNFTNWEIIGGGNPVHFFAGDVHVGIGEKADLPQLNQSDEWAGGGYYSFPVDNFRSHNVPGGDVYCGYLLCEVYPNTKTPVHVMLAPLTTIPYTGKPSPISVKRKYGKKNMSQEELLRIEKLKQQFRGNGTVSQ